MKQVKPLNKEVLNLLVSYFKTEVPLLERSYSWKIPKIEGFEHSLQKGFLANVKLKHFLHDTWTASNDDCLSVAKLVIEKWGGVRGNKEETLKKYIDRVGSGNFEMPFQGLASYTKLYSIVEPQRFAIYDARVAVTLNALQCNYQIKSGVAFNYLSGRNNTTGNTTNKQGFSQQKEYSVTSLVKKGWERVTKDDTYQVYLDYLFACIEHNPDWKLYELEMVLFANAENEAEKAMGLKLLTSDKEESTTENSKKPSKMTLAKSIFEQAQKASLSRKEILIKFQDEAGLTKAGANTYYQKIKSAF